MKKDAGSNPKITDYFQTKGITPIGRVFSRPTLDSMTPKREKQNSTMSKLHNKSITIN